MKEIGGYLELDQWIHHVYHPGAIALNTARNALVYLAKVRQISKIYIPYYLCDSVANVCIREGIPHAFYHVDKNFLPLFDNKLKENEYLYIVNYFGQLSQKTLHALQEEYGHIVVDNVQAFFQQPIANVDTIYSCRKFFGVPDGAYLYTDAARLALPVDISMHRTKHLLGRFESGCASDYYNDFRENDALFDDLPLMAMSKLTRNILGVVDYQQAALCRRQNWDVYHNTLGPKNRLTLHTSEGPYMYPFYCENGAAIRKKLAEKKIYIPTLWPNVLDYNGCGAEKDYALNILPLPVDQRYNQADINTVVEEIEKCMKI